MAGDYLSEADALYEQGGMENYNRSIDLYLEVLKANPNDYGANWKCARAYREYGEEAKKQSVEGWKEICARYGKEGMKYAKKAMELGPNKPHGYYYYGLNVGFEKAYELDKMYNEAGPILALGRFWAVVPWPYKDKKKALQYYREYQSTRYFAEKDEGKVYLAELLLNLKGKENIEEAKTLLEKASQSDENYFRDWAKRLLKTIK
jgi:lipopolysaccharide biosynthesis regulator YciM